MSQRLALLIGNNEYHDPSLAKLVSPSQDVIQLGKLLSDPQIGGFDRVDALENQPFAGVRRSIASFFTNNKRDDLLMLYFSGHGILDDNGQLYLAVQDTERELLSATSIEAPFITSLMDRSISRRQVLVLDCCHSGAFGRSKGGLGASVGTATTFEGKGYGRIVLTASDATQYAWDGDDLLGEAQTSVFTRHLVEGLSTGAADMDADGQITLDELYDYIYERVVAETPRQTPAKWSYKQQGTIVIAHNPSPVVQPVALPAELTGAVESPFTGVRAGAVQDLGRLLSSSDRGVALSARLALEKLSMDDSRKVSSAAQAVLAGEVLVQPTPQPVLPTSDEGISSKIVAGDPNIAPSTPPVAVPAGTSQHSRSTSPPRSARGKISTLLANPYITVSVLYITGWLFALFLAQITNAFFSLLIGWALAGFAAGQVLARDKPQHKWVLSILLAASWSLPAYLSLYSDYFLMGLLSVSFAGLVNGLSIILVSRPAQ